MSDEQSFEVFDTRYALTQGIIKRKVCQSDQFPTMVWDAERHLDYLHGDGKDWHRTWGSALVRAQDMRRKKIKSLRKTLKKLEALQFTQP